MSFYKYSNSKTNSRTEFNVKYSEVDFFEICTRNGWNFYNTTNSRNIEKCAFLLSFSLLFVNSKINYNKTLST